MKRKRPNSVLVLAILHLVGGGLGLLVDLCAGGGQVISMAQQSGRPANLQSTGNIGYDLAQHVENKAPGYRAYILTYAGFGLVLDFMLLSAGTGLLLMQQWARVVSIVYAIFSIVLRAINVVYQVGVVYPVVSAFLPAYVPPGMDPGAYAAGAKFGFFGGACGGTLFVIYPVVVLIVLLSPSVSAAFRARPERADRDRDYEDYYDRDYSPSRYYGRD